MYFVKYLMAFRLFCRILETLTDVWCNLNQFLEFLCILGYFVKYLVGFQLFCEIFGKVSCILRNIWWVFKYSVEYGQHSQMFDEISIILWSFCEFLPILWNIWWGFNYSVKYFVKFHLFSEIFCGFRIILLSIGNTHICLMKSQLFCGISVNSWLFCEIFGGVSVILWNSW